MESKNPDCQCELFPWERLINNVKNLWLFYKWSNRKRSQSVLNKYHLLFFYCTHCWNAHRYISGVIFSPCSPCFCVSLHTYIRCVLKDRPTELRQNPSDCSRSLRRRSGLIRRNCKKRKVEGLSVRLEKTPPTLLKSNHMLQIIPSVN